MFKKNESFADFLLVDLKPYLPDDIHKAKPAKTPDGKTAEGRDDAAESGKFSADAWSVIEENVDEIESDNSQVICYDTAENCSERLVEQVLVHREENETDQVELCQPTAGKHVEAKRPQFIQLPMDGPPLALLQEWLSEPCEEELQTTTVHVYSCVDPTQQESPLSPHKADDDSDDSNAKQQAEEHEEVSLPQVASSRNVRIASPLPSSSERSSSNSDTSSSLQLRKESSGSAGTVRSQQEQDCDRAPGKYNKKKAKKKTKFLRINKWGKNTHTTQRDTMHRHTEHTTQKGTHPEPTPTETAPSETTTPDDNMPDTPLPETRHKGCHASRCYKMMTCRVG